MAQQTLDNKPGQVYDPEDDGSKVDVAKGLREAEAHANSPKEDDVSRGIAEAEKFANNSDGNSSAKSTREGGLYRPSPSGRKGKNKSSRIKITKKQGYVGGGIAGLLVAGIIAISTILSGPLQILQFANLLERFHITGNNSLTEGRLGAAYRYLRHPDAPEARRVGIIARNSSTKIEASFRSRGLNPVWEGGRLTRFNVNPADLPALRSAGLGPNIVETNGTFRIVVDPPGTSARAARATLGEVTDVVRSLDVKVGAIGMRNLRTKAGVGFLDNSVRRTVTNIDATLQEKSDRYRELRADDVESDPTRADVTTTVEEDADGDGTTDSDVDRTEIDGKSAAASKVDSIRNNATRGIAVIGLACAAYSIVDSADTVRKANVVMPLIRFGMRAMTIASQVQAGGDAVDLESIGFFAQDMYDETAAVGAKSWRDAASINANLGEPATGVDIPSSAHPTQGGNFILDAFNSIPGFLGNGIDTVCSAVSSFAGQVISYAISFTPAGFATDVAGDLVAQVLINEYADDLIAVLAGEQIDTDTFKGGTLGAAADYGVMLAANEHALSLGGRKLSNGEVAELNQYYAQQKKEELNNLSIFDRYLALNNPESLFAKSVTTTASLSSPKRVIGNINSGKYASALGDTFSSVFIDKTYAQANDSYSYQVDQIGFSLEEQDNESYQNPYTNAVNAAPYLEENASKIETCFGLSLNSDGSLVPIGEGVRIIDEQERSDAGCNNTDQIWTQIRFYILDQNVASSYDCRDTGDPVSCEVTGAVNSATISNTTTQTTNTGASAEYIPDCSVNNGNAQIACVAIDTMLDIPYRNAYSNTDGCREFPSASNDPDPQQLDCSAFTSMAVYRAFGTDAPRTSVNYLTSPLFEVVGDTRDGNIGNIRDIQPGDLVGRGRVASGGGGSGHIGIVVSYDPATQELVTVETDRCDSLSRVVTTKGLEIDGRDNYTYSWAVRYVGPR